MEIITKSVQEWHNFLKELDEIKKSFGNEIINNTIIFFQNITNGKMEYLANFSIVNLLVKYNIVDVSDALSLLEKLRYIVSIDYLLEKINTAKLDYGIDHISFIKNGEGKPKNLDSFCSVNIFERVFLPIGNFAISEVDLTTNGLRKRVIYQDEEFIIDKRSLNDRESNVNRRELYTCDFRFRINGLPLKEEMDAINVPQEKIKLFEEILLILRLLPHNNVEILINEPNQEFDLLGTLGKYYTYFSDGVISAKPREIVTSKVTVNDANFVVITSIEQRNISRAKIIVNNEFFSKFLAYLDSVPNLKGLIGNLISDEKLKK